MKTIKLYDDEPYEKNFKAKIVSIEQKTDGGYRIELDRTLFFPEEGGQSPDTGCLGDIRVIHVEIKDNTVWHETEEIKDLTVGDEVIGNIDWEHRFSNMQNHTGEHILSGLLHRDLGSENVGFHLSDNIVTLDTSKSLSEEDIAELEKKANEAVYLDLPVHCRYYGPEEAAGIEYRSKKEFKEDVRLVTIPGVDVCACCAPHVRHTGEIGIIKIIKAINYKGGMRLTILSGKRAYEYLDNVQKLTEKLSHMLSENTEKLPEAVERLMKEIEGYKAEKKEAQKERLMLAVEEALKIGDGLIFTGDTDNITQRNAVNALSEKLNGVCAVFAGNDKDGYRYILSRPGGDAREAAALLKEKLGAKGGGSKEMVQGSILSSETEIRQVLIVL